MKKRQMEVAVISDVHLGTEGCHADELLIYLNSIKPKKLILNGDIIDIWQFNKKYFPLNHMRVVRKIIGMASKGTEVFYITGNHDEMLRKFSGSKIGNFHVVDKLILKLDGKRAWFFHGDVFDSSTKNSKWFAKLGGYGYRFLIQLNRIINWMLIKVGKDRYSLSTKIKQGSKDAKKYIDNFETTATELAIESGYDFVICGHIHQPKKEVRITNNGNCTYLNSGDWVESLTALEYSFKRWKVYRYEHDKLSPFFADEELKDMNIEEFIANISFKEEIEALDKAKKSKKKI